jgi:predicted DNA repair protein MutK
MVSNILNGSLINSTVLNNTISSILSSLLPALKPLISILLSLVGIYIIYLIIKSIFAYLSNKRIKRIDKNVEEILLILKNKDKQVKKKAK